ncbi:hypothetical protein AHMF7605_21715 [Adhaeribacter arboris]|uniref:PAS domain S-box protein n=1 Tax=Adhaeribacter arboris TaxID=2072846 RepID=A0A2T2YKA2_9BACT|nr:PAS domain S-box protein [Adhaeribacter arboris]PSR55932.1 hypothetical protein AHMF7605_21715 [Adhaeribacter arboris]
METNQITKFLTEKPEGFLITGIGASAGGVQALKEFFQHVPEDSGVAYVVILHLSPDHDSQLAQVLQAVTTIPVRQVTEKVKIEPDHIFVVPPNQHLIMEDGFVVPSVNLHLEDRRAPVDIFFRTLADSYGPRAICVVLSGTGANGSMGLKRIKEMGGVAYVQNPREAEFNEMPRNAIATDLVDEVLPVADIPRKIIIYQNSVGTIEIPVEAEKRPEQQQQALREIFTQLRLRTGHDFSNYKHPTLLRRIERRINIRNLPDLPSYAAFVQQNLEEVNALLKDLLISVTNFFRDKKPFEAMEREMLPVIFKNKTAQDEVRIWVAGCATGEEAYSLAMLVAERTLSALNTPKVQIFATDIDDAALTVAREGLYTLNDAADVSPERLRNFFQKEGDNYRIKREIREMILFASHNFLKDPPFSRLDLVTCRNVLIYLNATAQERVMETFHFALKSGGYLFLGSSESVDGASDLYAPVSRDNHIFQAREVALRHYPVPESVSSTFQFQKNEPLLQKQEVSIGQSLHRISFGELHQKMLEQYAPPSLVVNADYDILHMSEKVGRFLEFSGGEPTKNLLKLIKPELRLELRSALHQAAQRQAPMEVRNIPYGKSEERQLLSIQIRPVTKEDDPANAFILVIFDQNQKEPSAETIVLRSDEPVARHLEEELIQVKAQLRHSTEQFEYQAEELKASNEELQAINEELRSAAEELETSKEELQSINEEVRTVNQELKVKIEEMGVTSNNLQNLINSAEVATIFLDRAFCTQLYTPEARQIFNLIPTDYGRPISDITHRLEYRDLLHDVETVLEKLTIIEREVTTTDDQAFMMRILPYRTTEDRINGVVITFFDITKRKQSEKALQQSEDRLRLLIESAKDYAIFTIDTERRVISWSSGAQMILGYTEAEIMGKSGDIVFVPEDRDQMAPEKESETAHQEGRAENERWHLRKDGSRFWGSGITQPLRDEQGKTIGFVKIMRDLTEQRQMEEAKFFLASIVETSNDSVITIDFQRNITSWNKAAENLYGFRAEEAIGKNLTLLTLLEDFAEIINWIDAIEHSREVAVFDTVRHNKEGEPVYLEIVMSPVLNTFGQVIGISIIAHDVSERKRREANLAFLAKISIDFAPLLTIQQVMELVGEQLARYLLLSRCHFALVDEDDDRVEVIYEYRRDEKMPSLMGTHHLSDNLTEEGRRYLRVGKVAVINATMNSRLVKISAQMLQQIGFGSRVDVPHLAEGQWKFLLTVGRAEVGEWRSDEVELLQELAAKIYIRLERARVEEALHQSEERLQKALSIETVGIIYFDLEGGIQDANVAFEHMSGFSKEDFVQGKVRWEEITPPEYMEITSIARQEYEEKGQNTPYEKQYIRPDGTRWWGRFAGRRLSENEYVEFVVDITERKQAEEELRQLNESLERQVSERTQALRESRDLLQSVFDTTLLSLSIIKAVRDENETIIDFRIELVNKELEQETGRTDLVGKLYSVEYPGIKQAGLFDLMLRVMDTGEPGQVEYYYPHENFNKWYSAMFVKLDDGLVASNLDITERKLAEAELTRNFTILKQAEEVAGMGSWEFDYTTNSFYWSEGMYQLFGLSMGSEKSPETYLDYVLEEDRIIAENLAQTIRHNPQPLEETLRIRVKEKVITLQIKGIVLRDDLERPYKLLCVDLDVSELKRLEQENLHIRLEQQKALLLAVLEAQQEERKRIAESLHNGVGQILYATKLNLDQLVAHLPKEVMTPTANLLSEAIQETRRVSHELVPLVLEDFGLTQAMEDLCQKYEQSAIQVNCEVDLEGRLESYLELAIYRMAQELLTNVVKHAQATEADLLLTQEEGEITLKLRDNGQGMNLKNGKSKGLGLRAIADRVKLLNGTFTIATPSTGKGTLMIIQLPVPI